ncbi:bifunctional phosphopantothenoylcysteine decarboxylase/phosphopantothenate synthase [Paracoccus sp. DMF-8]|uniref:bifunctional phosphopantothenoylcysteine decarboxylase/phosphopantothenate synthase n=1 Tax=Paracoccus sp. DMF-8 TaxID=3019445 RepID=UPI0023E8270F|nr:bifunctional phosphopantothenoylcysteine decarboxylase/phosphopantothenate synthase [Paracoccus sp. DMF-8]MDF3606625.1 bifunctional phosphopantothenoylcysteine decarboxylase/phosphopantothenate synthase [Paracoccus sp. DMF-8]
MEGRRILLIVGGGIAAIKIPELIRLMRQDGMSVTPVLTRAGAEFVTPLSLSALAEAPCHQELFDLTRESEMGHIQLSRAADLVVVAPATANLMARMAGGLADDLATTLLLATHKPVLIAPAMNVRMWGHAATVRNRQQLSDDGIRFVGPDEGVMACGEFGEGRMAEPATILAAIRAQLSAEPPLRLRPETAVTGPVPSQLPELAADLGGLGDDADRPLSLGDPLPPDGPMPETPEPGPLQGQHVIVTSGPTHEPIDPVRYIANRSSGAQGAAIAAALVALGARVSFVTGPAQVPAPEGVEVIAVESAQEMRDAVELALPADAAIMAAAVADWRIANASSDKIKKDASGSMPVLELVENPDILAWISRLPQDRPRLVVGFAAETTNVLQHATEKWMRKGCDWIVANDVSPETGIMGGSENAVTLISRKGPEKWPRLSKPEVARRLAARVADALTHGVA